MMILVVEAEAVDSALRRCLVRSDGLNRVFLATGDADAGLPPAWSESGAAARPAGTVLGELLQGERQDFRILIVWRQPDAALCSTLELLAQPALTNAVEASVLLVGPLDQDADLASLLAVPGAGSTGVVDVNAGANMQYPFLRTLLYLGNEDGERRPVDPPRRNHCIRDLLFAIRALPEADIAAMGLFPRSASADQGHCAAFALRSWIPTPERLHDAVRSKAAELLRREYARQIAGGMGAQSDDLERLPESMLNRLATLDAPRPEAGGDPYRARILADPTEAYATWRCPFFRSAALRDGSEMIRGTRHGVLAYFRDLQAQLRELATQIRGDGQERFERERVSLRDRIATGASLGTLACHLRTFFPACDRLANEGDENGRAGPCEPGAAPGIDAVQARFIAGAQQVLEERAVALFTGAHAWACGIGAGIFAGAAAIAARAGCGPAWIWGLGACGVLLPALFVWLGRRRAAGVRDALAAHRLDAVEWLRGIFARKVDWVVDKTHRTLRGQLLGEARSLGRRLGDAFDVLFKAWTQWLGHAPAEDGPRGESASGAGDELPDAIATELEDRIAAIATQIGRAAVQEAAVQDLAGATARMIEDAAAQLAGAFGGEPVPHERVIEEARTIAADWRKPPLLARLDETDLSSVGVRRLWLIPHGYPSTWETMLRATGFPVNIVHECRRAEVGAPLLWVCAHGLSVVRAKDSLRVMEIAQ